MNRISRPSVNIFAYCFMGVLYMSDSLVVWYTSLLSLYVVYKLGRDIQSSSERGLIIPQPRKQMLKLPDSRLQYTYTKNEP